MDVRWGEQKEVDRKRRKTIDDIMVAGGRELIDTLWNVNFIGVKKSLLKSRINRYIMECKQIRQMIQTINTFRINRYIMECKLFITSVHEPTLIEN